MKKKPKDKPMTLVRSLGGGDDRSSWATTALLIKRLQIHDRIKHRNCHWSKYPQNRFAWVTSENKIIGVGFHADRTLTNAEKRKGVFIVQIPLPFKGCGRDVHDLVLKTAFRQKKIIKSMKTAEKIKRRAS